MSFLQITGYIVFFIIVISLGIRQRWKKIIEHSTATRTIINEAKVMKQLPTQKIDETAVIIGAGIGGCLSAAMLSRHFTRVIMIDPVDIDRNPHSYISQIDQAHLIGPITLHACESLWPNGIFLKELEKYGGNLTSNIEHPNEFCTKSGYLVWSNKIRGFDEKPPRSIRASRMKVHHVLRHLIQSQTSNVEFVLGKVKKIHCDDQNSKLIKSIDVIQMSKDYIKNISCSFLVDCSGSSNAYRNLISQNPNFTLPEKEEYCMHVQYSTNTMELHPDLQQRWPKIKTVKHHKDETYNSTGTVAILNPSLTNEKDFWIMMRSDNSKINIANMSYDSKPLSEMPKTIDEIQNGWNASHFAVTGKEKEPWFNEVMDLLRENEELTGEKIKNVRYRDYQSYCLQSTRDNLPQNMILLGDTFCKLNPAFGQGCQKASSEVMILNNLFLNSQDSSRGKKPQQSLQLRLDKIISEYCAKQEIYAKRLFFLNRALDLSQIEVIKANPHLSPKTGAFVRFLSKGMWAWIAKNEDLNLGDLFLSINLSGTGVPAQLLHPSNFLRIVYGALFL